MKKILSLIVLALFVVSMVPLAFAEEQENKGNLEKDEEGNLIATPDKQIIDSEKLKKEE